MRRVSSGEITTMAGTGVCGYSGDGGSAVAATLHNPNRVAVDGAGDLYISDRINCRVRRVSGGVITTVTGTGACAYGGDGGAATNASLNDPIGVALDGAGDLYIADRLNCRVRRVSAGVITTVAGTGACGYAGDGGPATSASLNNPLGVALDAAGRLYIADTTNCRVRRVSGGVITTVAGTGTCGFSGDGSPATAAALHFPYDVALDAAGELYIADQVNCRIRRVSEGIIKTVAGMAECGYSGDDAAATATRLGLPTGVALDAYGDLHVADTQNNRVRIVHTSACPFDLNDSGAVGFADLLIFAGAYNSTPPSPNWNPAADFNQSGAVSFPDLLLFAGSYNRLAPNCPP